MMRPPATVLAILSLFLAGVAIGINIGHWRERRNSQPPSYVFEKEVDRGSTRFAAVGIICDKGTALISNNGHAARFRAITFGDEKRGWMGLETGESTALTLHGDARLESIAV